jgi:3-oxoacyl-[acyl-carrier protein] reductase
MVRETLQAFGRIDILVNNAGGTASLLRIEDCPLEDFDKTMALNVRGTFLCCKAVIPVMKAQGSGVIINLSSRAGSQVTVPGDTVYGAAKAAIDRFSIGLGSEIKPYGIAVIAASPGRVKTETAVHSLRGKDADWSGWREPEDVGPAFVWLARQTADTFTMRVVNATDFGAKWP